MTQPEILKPLKTWSHLAGQRRKPSEYEIVSTNLHYTTDNPDAPFELDPDFPMARWFKQYRNASPLRHADWDAFRDPDELIYRTYNMMQDGQETYVNGLLDQMSERGHDSMLERTWAGSLARLYTPSRYLFHALQMASAYLSQMAPASTISNCATYQTADSLRWLSHTAYRTRELSKTFGDIGLGDDERRYWETDPAWQGWRELVEKALIAWDWGETFAAFSLVIRPAVEEADVPDDTYTDGKTARLAGELRILDGALEEVSAELPLRVEDPLLHEGEDEQFAERGERCVERERLAATEQVVLADLGHEEEALT